MTRFAIFVFALFMCGAMSVLNAQVEVPKEVKGDEEYINWSTAAYSAFIVHPNGNLIVNRDNEFYELDAITGKELRAFPVQYGFQDYIDYDVTPDGKYFAYSLYGDSTVTFIIDYESGEVYKRLRGLGQEVAFLNNTQLLVERFGKGIGIYTFGNDNEVTVFAPNRQIFTASADGKYIASVINAKEGSNSEIYTWFELWDAETLELLKFEKFEWDIQVIDIQFSPDSKYVGFHSSELYIYNLQNFTIANSYDKTETIYSAARQFCFLDNDLIAITAAKQGQRNIMIFDINDSSNKKLFYHEGNGGGGIGYSKILNSLFVRGNGLISLNLDTILSDVGVETPDNPQIRIEYKNKVLSIFNLFQFNQGILAKVVDIQGNIVFQFQLQNTNDGLFSIPITLPTGTYILSLPNNSQSYKFIVMN